MKYVQLRKPRLNVRDLAGNCLKFARRVFWDHSLGGMPTAWSAWQKTKHKHYDRNFPKDVVVFVWWDWTGDIGYGRQRYGHCAVHVPGKGILSSPPRGYGQAWFRNVDELSRVFGAKYMGWSEDMGGHRVAQPAPESAPKKSAVKKGVKVKHYFRRDKTANGTGKRVLKPGEGLYLNQVSARNSQATNIAHGVGLYSFTGHVYAKGTPGDVLEVNLLWQYVKSKPVKNSPHYVQRFVFDKDGLIRENVEFKRAVTAGYAVYLRVMAPKSNKGDAEVTLLASDAYLFV